MSETGDGLSTGREWAFYVADMIHFAEAVLTYTSGIDLPAFQQDRRTYDATLRNLELIGEAATHIPASVRESAIVVPWRMLIATRNRLIHGYLGIDDDTIWSIVQGDIPALLQALRQLRSESTL